MKNFRHTESMPTLAILDEDSSSSSGDDTPTTPIPRARPPFGHAASMVDMAGLSLSDDDDSSEEGERRRSLANVIPPHMGHKKVLVTGGAGFVGSSVAGALLARGDDVVIVDEMNDYYDVRIKENNLQRLREMYPEEKRLAIYRGDICDEDFMLRLFEKERPQWVCHGRTRRCEAIDSRSLRVHPLEYSRYHTHDGIVSQVRCQELCVRLL